MSPESLEEQIGVTVSKVEEGKLKVKLDLIELVANAFNVTASELMERVESVE